MRLLEVGVGGEDLLGAAVKAQVHGAAVELGGELGVVGLALLPPGSDEGDLAGDAVGDEGALERGLHPLRPKERDERDASRHGP